MIHFSTKTNSKLLYETKPEDFNKIAFIEQHVMIVWIAAWGSNTVKAFFKHRSKFSLQIYKSHLVSKSPKATSIPAIIDYMFLLVLLTILLVSQLLIRELYSGHTSIGTHSGDFFLCSAGQFNDNCLIYGLSRVHWSWRHC